MRFLLLVPALLAQTPDPALPEAPEGFTVVAARPFVVIGNEPREAVIRHANGTVLWAAEKLKQDFFRADPPGVIEVWLLADAASFKQASVRITGAEPETPYGYWSAEHHALIMDISTGGGTLVHEMVHPYMDQDFPSHPPWINEGMGSLFEACGERDGHIVGYPNWRLPALQEAIRAGTLPAFTKLMAMDETTFYGDEKGTNYAQSRYLLLWMQENAKLVDFYRAFRDGQAADPTGILTLSSAIGGVDLGAFQKRWEAWVLTLGVPTR